MRSSTAPRPVPFTPGEPSFSAPSAQPSAPAATSIPRSHVWAPWNLICADQVTAADGAEIYNPAPIRLGSHAILSQDAFLCGATHDYDSPAFPLLAYTMEIGPYAWICARASVAPGVNVAEGAVLGLASVATRDLEPWTIYAGSPAARIKSRTRTIPESQ